jgi:hypothetical protein
MVRARAFSGLRSPRRCGRARVGACAGARASGAVGGARMCRAGRGRAAACVRRARVAGRLLKKKKGGLVFVTRVAVDDQPCAHAPRAPSAAPTQRSTGAPNDHNASQQHSTTQQHQPAAGSARCTCLNTAAACVTAI